MADGATATRGDPHTEAWQDKPWKHFQRVVFRLQKRIYQAQVHSTHDTGHQVEKLHDRKRSRAVLQRQEAGQSAS